MNDEPPIALTPTTMAGIKLLKIQLRIKVSVKPYFHRHAKFRNVAAIIIKKNNIK